MGLKFFADHCVPNSVIQYLCNENHEVLKLREHLPVESPDQVVIEKAQQLNAILISLNGDFSDIVTYHPPNYKGIIAIQLRNRPEIILLLLERLKKFLLSQNDMRYYKGKLLILEVHRIRIRQ